MIRSLNEVLGRVTHSARGRSRRTDGGSSSVSAPAKDPAERSGTGRGGRGRRRSRRRSPLPVASAASEEEEDGAVPEAGTAGEEDEGDHQ